MTRLEEIEARLRKASEGSWKSYWRETDGIAECGIFYEKVEGHAYSIARCPKYVKKAQWDNDGSFIANAKPDIAFLLARVKALEDERDELKTKVNPIKERIKRCKNNCKHLFCDKVIREKLSVLLSSRSINVFMKK